MKKLHALLMLIILTMFMFLLISCRDGEDSFSETIISASESLPETEESETYDSPEIKDFEGYKYNILETSAISVFSWHKQVPEDFDGEVVNDAIVNRNRTVEEKYNITINQLFNDDPLGLLRRSISAGEDICDVAYIPLHSVFGFAQEKYLYDYNGINSLRLEQPWWDGRISKTLEIKNKLYVAAGDITTNDDASTLTVLYNKKLYTDFGYKNPYTLVTDGGWTFDSLQNMIKDVSSDLNGDGAYDENDRWGMASESGVLYYFCFGTGEGYIAEKDGEYRFRMEDKSFLNKVERSFEVITTEGSMYDLNKTIKDKTTGIYKVVEQMFIGDRLLFNVRLISDAFYLRNMESDFGFLPIPKYNEDQEEYYSWVTFNVQLPVLPISITDTERSGLLMEAMAFESLTLREPFYEYMLGGKIARDSNDTKMLELIVSSKYYDFDGANSGSGIQSGIFSMMEKNLIRGELTLASDWAKLKTNAEAKLAKFIATFE